MRFTKSWISVNVLLVNIVHTIDSLSVNDVLELSKALVKKWPCEQVTFIDLTTDATDSDAFEVQAHLMAQTTIASKFLSSRNISSSDLADNSPQSQAVVIVNSADPTALLEKASFMGLLETHTWFTPANKDLSYIKLRLDSNLYLMSKENGAILLNEAYSIKQGPHIRQPIGSFSTEKGLTLTELDMWERRKDLSNVTLLDSLIIVKAAKLTIVSKTATGVIQRAGYFVDLIDQLQTVLKFKVVLMTSSDGQYGSRGRNGSWNGMLGMLVRKETDICSYGLSNDLERGSALDYTIPVLEQPITLMMKRPPEGGLLNVWAYLKTFTPAPWLIIIILMLALMLGLTIVNKFKVRRFNAIGVTFISLLQRDHQCHVKRHSSRTILLIVCMYFYLIFVYYSSVLTSYMTALSPPIEIRSFADVLKYDYHVVAVKGTVTEPMLINAKPPSVLHDIYQKDMKGRPRAFLPINEIRDELQTPKTVLYGQPVITYGESDIMVLTIPEATQTYLGFFLQKNSELTKLFNYHMLKMDQSGVIAKIYLKWFNQTLSNDGNSGHGSEAETIVLNYDNLIFPIFLLLSGIVFAGICLVFEFVVKIGGF